MLRTMFVGQNGSGKLDLIRHLSEQNIPQKRPMAVQYHGPFINTPGEFLEHPWFYRALITTAVECDILVFVHKATCIASVFPPRFGSMFNRKVIGVVTASQAENANVSRSERFLTNAGAGALLHVDTGTGNGLEILHTMLAG